MTLEVEYRMKKLIVIGIIVLFVGVGFSSGIGVNVEQSSSPLNIGELAWWEFNEGSGSTAGDSSGHGYDGTVVGATWTANGLNFDGVDDYVDFDNHSVNLGINKTDTLILLVRFRSTGSGMIYSMSYTHPDGPYFDLMLDDEGKITVEMGVVFYGSGLLNLSTSGSYNDGNWHLVKIYFEGGPSPEPTLTIYVDDKLDGSKTDWMHPMINEDFHTAKVGRDSITEIDYFSGEIDDIKIYIFHYWWGPPFPPDINGPSSGKPGESLTFIFNAEHPEYGVDVRFHINWGDGNTDTTTYVPEGTDKPVSHVWDIVDTYTITAWTEDEYGQWSFYPTTFTVIIPRDKSTDNMLFRLLERFPLIDRLLDIGWWNLE
jgi:hypothetical protein